MSNRKRYRSWAPTQSFLLPPLPMEWLPKGHLAYCILDVVNELDLSVIEASIQEKDARGTRPYAPQMMVALLLYGYSVGVFSSRKLERATYEDVAFRVLAGGEHPHFTTINGFRKEHLDALRSLFLQVFKLCQAAGLVKLGHVALDGTKVHANASKHKAMSYDRMLKSEFQLTEEIDALMRRADELDSDEDKRFGKGHSEEDLPAELQRREKRLEKIREADATKRKPATIVAKGKAAQAKELAPDKDDEDLEPPKTGDGLPKHEPPAATDGKARGKAQMNFTDPDSGIMKRDGAFLQGYNCQAAVDEAHQIIVAQAVSNLSPDNKGRAIYARRKATVEPVFGQIKEPRGFRRFLLRGIAKVQGEWSLVCTIHNLLKLWRNQMAQTP